MPELCVWPFEPADPELAGGRFDLGINSVTSHGTQVGHAINDPNIPNI